MMTKKYNTQMLADGLVGIEYTGNTVRLNTLLFEAFPDDSRTSNGYRKYYCRNGVNSNMWQASDEITKADTTAIYISETDILTMKEWNQLSFDEKILGHQVLIENKKQEKKLFKLLTSEEDKYCWAGGLGISSNSRPSKFGEIFGGFSYSLKVEDDFKIFWSDDIENCTIKASNLLPKKQQKTDSSFSFYLDEAAYFEYLKEREKELFTLVPIWNTSEKDILESMRKMAKDIGMLPVEKTVEYVPKEIRIGTRNGNSFIGLVSGEQELRLNAISKNWMVVSAKERNDNNGQNFKYVDCNYEDLKLGDLFQVFDTHGLKLAKDFICWTEHGGIHKYTTPDKTTVKKIVKI